MARRVLHLLLIAAIIACPIGCRPGLCALGDGCGLPHDFVAECGHSCDGGHSHEHSDHQPLPPRDDDPCDHKPCQDSCQCICGGAILPGSAELDVVLLLTPSFDSMATVGDILDSLATHRLCPNQTAPDDDAAPSGRAIRCMHCSLLC